MGAEIKIKIKQRRRILYMPSAGHAECRTVKKVRCDPDQSYKMPRGAGQPDGIFSRGKGYSYLDVEEAVGIGILVVVLAVLLIIGCWYYWKRSGYKSLWNKSSGVSTLRTSASGRALLDSKGPLQQYSNFNSVVPDAPPAYDKISAEPLPPPYSP
ncbi:melanoma antigen recognized by T-cells 1 isoform X1 [Alligator sinensis]|uniref:Melanoma antigen recognized by T-cells 1 isoform X1 n=2 Tax=Alligator sinensis TaxID=38654 RepID=A0A1U7RI32_ALLSI|nr:melanoma antigen recognized by T-cells 1 isoform X1 [Alligator sinensis]